MKVIFILLFSVIASTAYSNNCIQPDKGFRNNEPGRGWFWGQKVCEPVKDNKTDTLETADTEKKEPVEKEEWKLVPKTANIPWEIIDQIDPDEVAQKIEPEAKKVAVMYPTEENIMNYRKLSKWMMGKAKTFAMNDLQVRTENPGIAPKALTAPITRVRQTMNYLYNEENEAAVLKPYADRAKLVVYTRDNCKYCYAQYPLLQRFTEMFGWEVIERKLEENLNEAVMLSVEYTPDIFILLNTSQGVKYQRIATGLTQYTDLVKAAIRGLRYAGENIPEIEDVPNILEVGQND